MRDPGPSPASDPAARARVCLAVFTAINLLNYLDRTVVAAVLPRLESGLGLDHTQGGLVVSAFMLGYFLTSPLFGYLGDRYSRTRLAAMGIVVWSGATVLSGLASRLWTMIAARVAVGVGEASYAAVAPAMIADYYPRERRNQAIAFFYVAIPLGSALGYLAGGFLEAQFGWRAAFFLVGTPGLLAAALVRLVPDPARGASDSPSPRAAAAHARAGPATQEPAPAAAERSEKTDVASFGGDIRALLKNSLYVLVVLGYAAYTFGLGGFAAFGPKYLEATRGVPLELANYFFGAITVLTGIGGTLAGGWLAAAARARRPSGDIVFLTAATIASVPFAVLAFLSPRHFYAGFAGAEFLLFLGQGPVNVLCLEAVPARLRATAMAVSVFAIHLFGDLTSPALVGLAADHVGLARAVLILPGALVVATLLWAAALRAKAPADSARAPAP